jgi:hypothetical protein
MLRVFEAEFRTEAVPVLRERRREYRQSPMGAGWDGTSKMITQ